MRYKCEFPSCDYITNYRHQIELHHIDPVELNGVDDKYNRIWLCPNHHCRIYIPKSKSGKHSIKTEDSIILNRKFQSTAGIILEYIDVDGKIDYWLVT